MFKKRVLTGFSAVFKGARRHDCGGWATVADLQGQAAEPIPPRAVRGLHSVREIPIWLGVIYRPGWR